jgi:hypothetical protein
LHNALRKLVTGDYQQADNRIRRAHDYPDTNRYAHSNCSHEDGWFRRPRVPLVAFLGNLPNGARLQSVHDLVLSGCGDIAPALRSKRVPAIDQLPRSDGDVERGFEQM